MQERTLLRAAFVGACLVGGTVLIAPEYWRYSVGGCVVLMGVGAATGFVQLERYFLFALMSAFVAIGPALALDLPTVNLSAWFGLPVEQGPEHDGGNSQGFGRVSIGWESEFKQVALIVWIVLVFRLTMRIWADQVISKRQVLAGPSAPETVSTTEAEG